jgi:hypothetical protein
MESTPQKFLFIKLPLSLGATSGEIQRALLKQKVQHMVKTEANIQELTS